MNDFCQQDWLIAHEAALIGMHEVLDNAAVQHDAEVYEEYVEWCGSVSGSERRERRWRDDEVT